ncbi:hypothetical protein SAMD00019534_088200 [Acytostelium subglobosum LB1]|uniref:hypothetical protein n=1 Tax=Acytostelium subglobosum LB1 TaxID=1410327 RepID=UPI0006450A6B|nr:hypothetical protein SAMD00019534_088200 [Acytostelium subglobosum LB1]GAM25645.1 hypothetical protein SAMD00019534_088200 [Acytostelium subglobosum LB1]|eukprot:XP_012751631.1 hypothetical protein SAMD00019534_088200 [Acytostelium subglobosum LB1]
MNSIRNYFSNWLGSEEIETNSEPPTPQWVIHSDNISLDGPLPVDASDGDKFICRCGQSKNYPYCDNSHVVFNQNNGSNVVPIRVAMEKDKVVFVCRCGYSKERPFCDGTHTRLKHIKNREDKENVVDYVIVVAIYAAVAAACARAYVTH